MYKFDSGTKPRKEWSRKLPEHLRVQNTLVTLQHNTAILGAEMGRYSRPVYRGAWVASWKGLARPLVFCKQSHIITRRLCLCSIIEGRKEGRPEASQPEQTLAPCTLRCYDWLMTAVMIMPREGAGSLEKNKILHQQFCSCMKEMFGFAVLFWSF